MRQEKNYQYIFNCKSHTPFQEKVNMLQTRKIHIVQQYSLYKCYKVYLYTAIYKLIIIRLEDNNKKKNSFILQQFTKHYTFRQSSHTHTQNA